MVQNKKTPRDQWKWPANPKGPTWPGMTWKEKQELLDKENPKPSKKKKKKPRPKQKPRKGPSPSKRGRSSNPNKA